MLVDGSYAEKKAIDTACEEAGKTIDGIGVTDLALMDHGQYQAVIRSACHAYAKGLFVGYLDSIIPF